MTWAGEHVSRKLNVTIDNKENQIISIQDTVGLALRNNPKRAHLLVSKLLGKHIPVPASLIVRSGQILGLQAYNSLQKRSEPVEAYLSELKECMNTGINGFTPMPINPPSDVVVVGYAETATSLGHIVADYLNAPYIHSTRYGNHSIAPYGKFEEAHSHATTHQLLPKYRDFLHNPKPMVLVDDELSTGKTIIATIEELNALFPREHYVVCTLIDCRSEKDKATMQAFAERIGTRIDVVYLAAGTVSYPSTILEDVKPVIAQMSTQQEKIIDSSPEITIRHADFTGYSDAKYGIQTFDNTVARNIVDVIEPIAGRTLVLGTEEFMYLPVQVAAEMENQGHESVFSSSTTRSPVIPFDSNEYAVKEKLTYYLPDNDERYAYNLAGFDRIIIVIDPDLSLTDFLLPNGLVSKLGSTVTPNIMLIEQRKFNV